MSLAHKDDYFETPAWLFNSIVNKTGLEFDLDMCASEENTTCASGGGYKSHIDENMDALKYNYRHGDNGKAIWCNPPRSKNGKFVNKVYEVWNENNVQFVMLLCWNDLGNKYGEKLIPHILNKSIEVHNLGKIKFNKNGIESEFVSRLTYFWAWFKIK
tara:strand:+ start:90 stop:563 length:474 start_codon:yes stop_codon:yes gene_type:complete